MNENSDHHGSCPSLIQQFLEQVKRVPDHDALITPGNVFSYRQLDQLSSRIAGLIRSSNVEPGAYIGVHTRSPELNIVFLLGIFRAHGIYVNLDPDLPAHRLDSVHEQLDISLVLSGKDEVADQWHDGGRRIVSVDRPELLLAETAGDDPPLDGHPNYIVATSGTTGEPKLVLGNSEGIAKYLEELRQTCPLTSSDTVLGLSSLAFDGAFREVFAPLTCGASLIWDNTETIRSPVRVMELLNQFHVSVLANLVPSRLRSLTELARFRGCRAESVRLVLTCGESLLYSDYEGATELFGEQLELVNQYGVSEYAMAATWKPISDRIDASEDGYALIGHPVGATRVTIVGDNRIAVPPGVQGEICLSGPGLALGYPADPGATARSFADISDDSGTPSRAYLTGDLAKRLDNGALLYLGRKDDEINIHGLRTNPMEVEAVLRKAEGVDNCTVVPTKLPNGDDRLVAYVAPAPGATLTTVSLRNHLKDFLLPGAIPASFLYVNALPVKPNGKIDKQNLPALGLRKRAGLGIDYVEPFTKTEQNLASLWQDLLDVERVGRSDDFLILGGDSITLFTMLNHVEMETGYQIPLTRFLDDLTVAKLGDIVDAMDAASQQLAFGESM